MIRSRYILLLGATLLLVSLSAAPARAAAQVKNVDLATVADLPSDLKFTDGIVYKTVGDKKLKMTIFWPKTPKFQKQPFVLFIHGGAWAHGNRFMVKWRNLVDIVRQLNAAGVVVASTDYRLTDEKDGDGPTVNDCVTDCKDALRFLIKNASKYHLDTDRIGTLGNSAGGHLSLMTGLAPDSDFLGDPALAGYHGRIVCVAAHYPLVSLVTPSILKNSNFDNPKRFIPVLGGPLEKHIDLAKKLSPILDLRAGDPPLFLAQGTSDTTLSDQNVIQMAAAARQHNIPTTLLLVKGAGHGFGGDKIDPPLPVIMKETSDFLLKYLLPGAK